MTHLGFKVVTSGWVSRSRNSAAGPTRCVPPQELPMTPVRAAPPPCLRPQHTSSLVSGSCMAAHHRSRVTGFRMQRQLVTFRAHLL